MRAPRSKSSDSLVQHNSTATGENSPETENFSAWQQIPETIMFDLGFAEIVLIGGASILLLGKHDMPLVFRLVGRGVGSISGLIQGGRARMSELSEGSELLQLQNEIRSNLDDLRVIKAELRSAGRLPGITGTSHPGSTALREKIGVSGGGDHASGLPQASNVHEHSHHQHFGESVAGQDIATATAMGVPMASKADRVGFGVGETATGRPHTAGLSAVGKGNRSDGSGLVQASSMARGEVEGMKSVSPGSDRLQKLAMAEVEFADKELYAPKIELVPGGADILNETIIDSLLQERYRRVLQGPRTPDIGEHADKGEQPSSG